MTTLAQLKAWLKTPQHIRRILVEIEGITDVNGTVVSNNTFITSGTLYLSNGAYTSATTDTPANKQYLPAITGGVSFSQSLSPNGDLSVSYGDIELDNTDGKYDAAYLNLIFVRKPITIYIGDPNWSKSDFKILFKGLVADLVASERNKLNIVITDKLEQLSTALSETTVLQETKNNAIDLVPVTFGECFNVTPLTYQSTNIFTSATGTVGSISGTGPWTATITGMTATDGLIVGKKILATAGTGRLYNGNGSAIITSINSSTSISYSVAADAGVTTPVAGTVTNIVPVGGNIYYVVHPGQIEDIIEVRDMGAPITNFTKDLTNGRFLLNQATFGQVTCSVQGDKPGGAYTNKIGEIIKNIVKNYGPANNRFTDSDIDLTNFTNFDASGGGGYNRPIGYYSSNRENLLDVCNKLAGSVRAKLMISVGPLENDSDVGKLKLIQLNTATSSTVNITSSDIEEFSISIQEKPPVRATTKLAYCKNWTVQSSGLAEGLPAKSKEDFASDWYFSTVTNNTVKTNYKVTSEPNVEETFLITKAGADSESSLRNSIWSTTRYVYTMVGYPHLFDLQVGDFVKVTNRRFNLNQSLGTVVTVGRDWISGRIELGVLV